MQRLVFLAVLVSLAPAFVAADPGVSLAFDEPNDPKTTTITAGDTADYTTLATTGVDLGNTDVEDKRITITLVNLTGEPAILDTLLNESIPDDQLCYPAGCSTEYQGSVDPSQYGGIGDYQVVTKVEQTVNGNHEATTKTIEYTAEPLGTLNIDYIGCNDVVVKGSQQYCTTNITDDNGDAVSNAEFTLRYQDTDQVLGTCTTNQDGYCAVEPTITRDPGDYTVDATATKQGWLPDNDGQPTDTFTVLDKQYTVENLETWADDFQTTTDEYFRGDTPRASFDVRNDVTGELLSPEDDIVTNVTLRVYDQSKNTEPLTTTSLTPDTNPDPQPGAFQFTLNQIPLSDDYLGQGKIFAFAINYTDNTGGQASKTVTIQNNPIEFTAIDDQTIPAGETRRLDLTDTINDLETPDGNINVSFDNTGPYTVHDASTLTYDITAPSQAAQQTISVEADDTDGSRKTQTFTATTPALQGPTAAFTFHPTDPVVNQTVMFNATQSSDPDGNITTYDWTFNGETAQGELTQASFATPEDYTVTLQVTDDDGLTGTANQTLTVQPQPNQPPTIDSIQDQTTTENTSYSLDANASDPDGDHLSWSLNGPDFLTIDQTGVITGTPDFTDAGTYTVEVTVSDRNLNSSETYQLSVSDANRDPSLDDITDKQITAGNRLEVDADASDPDGDSITYSINTSKGTFNENTGEWSWTPSSSDVGNYTFQVMASDGRGGSDTETFTVEVNEQDQPPTSSFTTTPNNPVTGQTVTLNATQSSDPDGNITTYDWTFNGETAQGEITQVSFATPEDYTVTLQVTDDDGLTDQTNKTVDVDQANRPPTVDSISDQASAENASYQYDANASDPDGDKPSWSISGADFLTINDNGLITGTPGFDDAGEYHITVSVNDGRGGSDTETYTLTVTDVNRDPVLEPIADQPGTKGTTVSIDADATDPDGDTVTYSISPDRGSFNTQTGEWTWIPSQTGTYTYTVTASDGRGGTDAESFTVTVTEEPNTPPFASFTTDPSNPVTGETVTLDAEDSFDSDGTIESYEWTFSSAKNARTGEQIQTSFDETGTYDITLTVKDDDGAQNSTMKTVHVDQANRAPNATYTFTPTSPDTEDTVTFTATSTDPDGDQLTHEWDFDGDGQTDANGSQVAHVFDGPGSYDVSLTSSDGSLDDSVTKTVSVELANQAPTADFNVTPPNPTTDTTTTLTSNGSDPDGQIVAYSWHITGPDGYESTINDSGFPEHVIVDGFPTAGTYTVTHTVEDNDGATDSITKDIGVAEANNAPQASFTINPENPLTDQFINFNDTSSDDDGEIVYNEWRLTGPNTDRYITNISAFATKLQDPGDYEMNLTVRDNDGANDTKTKIFTVDEAITPIANFTYQPDQPVENDTVTLNASESFDPDGSIESYQWFVNGVGAGTTETTTYTALDIQDDNVTLEVTDDDGLTTTTSKIIPVDEANDAPTAAFSISPNQTFLVGDNATFTSEGFDDDGTIEDYKWTIQQPNNITFERNNSDLTSITEVFLVPGDYTVTHTVTDDDGATDAATKIVTVGDGTRPVARLDTSRKATKNNDVELDASDSTDADGTITTYHWTVTVRDTTIVDTTTTSPTLDYTPPSTGEYEATVTVTDNDGFTDTARASTTVSKETVTVEPDTEVTLGQYGVYSDGGLGVIQKGEPFTVRAGISNDGPQQADDLRLTFTLPEYGYERNGQLFNSGDENGETRQIKAYLPSYIPAGKYTGYVRVRGDDVHRQKTVPVTVTR